MAQLQRRRNVRGVVDHTVQLDENTIWRETMPVDLNGWSAARAERQCGDVGALGRSLCGAYSGPVRKEIDDRATSTQSAISFIFCPCRLAA